MFCAECGAEISDKAVMCPKCGVAVPSKCNVDNGDNAALRMLVPIGRSGWAIAAGYFGLFSLIPFVGVLAILFGFLAIADIKKHPDKHGLCRAWFGIGMGALTLLAYVTIFVCALSE